MAHTVLQVTENWAWPENEANSHVLDLIVLSYFANGTVSPSHQIHYGYTCNNTTALLLNRCSLKLAAQKILFVKLFNIFHGCQKVVQSSQHLLYGMQRYAYFLDHLLDLFELILKFHFWFCFQRHLHRVILVVL